MILKKSNSSWCFNIFQLIMTIKFGRECVERVRCLAAFCFVVFHILSLFILLSFLFSVVIFHVCVFFSCLKVMSFTTLSSFLSLLSYNPKCRFLTCCRFLNFSFYLFKYVSNNSLVIRCF